MVTKSFACPNGHQWRDATDIKRCPICGAEAETIVDGNSHLESTGAGPTQPGSTTSEESNLSRFGRYRIVDELGHGGMGIVYRAFDPVHQRQVALKRLPSNDPTLLSRFKHEFRVLADVDHPNVVKLFELTSDGETWFFTMEIIEGVDLLTYVRHDALERLAEVPNQADDENGSSLTAAFHPFERSEENMHRLRDGFAQLTGAIAALHARGIVHRDIKPSNVIVTPAGRVVLLDFGLAAETDPSGSHLSLHQDVLGTAAYMSPEQAACDPVSAASDWYSLGVMLYQTLTGRLPFAGKLIDILAKKQNQDPVPPCEIEPSVTETWNELCLKLLSRSPEDRPGADETLQRLGSQTLQHAPTKAAQPDEDALVGRESQLQSLHNTWEAVQGGQAKCVFIEGGSGTGKSALAEAFVEQATSDGAVVLKGRCYEMESVPFKAIDGLIDALVAYLRHLSRADAAALMPRDVHALARVFPVIDQIKAVARLPRRQIDVFDQQELNRRAIGALRELLTRMGDRYPLIVYIDDLQWGDEDSAAMLSDLLQPPDPPMMLLLGTYRSEDADTSQFLQSFRQIQRQRELPLESLQIEVTPLEHSDAVKLALALLNRNDEDAGRSAESIAQESAGNPFFVSELVKHLQLRGGRLSNSENKESLALLDMIWARVQQIPEESQRLLAVVALWGQPLPLDRALHIADVGQVAVGPLRTGHLIRTVGLASSPKIETYHDRIRESVAQRLDQATKQQHHFRIAEDCARQSPLDADTIMNRLRSDLVDGSAHLDDQLEVVSAWYDIAFHFDAAERADLAFPYALATADKARSQFSLEVAEQQYFIADRGIGNHYEEFRLRVTERLGDVLMLRGDYQRAAHLFEAARFLATDNLTRAQILGKLGELAFKQGNMSLAIETNERAVELLGWKVPTSSVGRYVQLFREVFVQVLHTSFPKRFLARIPLKSVEKELLNVRLDNRLVYAYWFGLGKVPCLWIQLRGMNLAERYPPTLELARAYAIHTPVMSLLAFFNRGLTYSQHSRAIYESFGDLQGQGLALHYNGLILYVAARYEECIEKCREAVRMLRQTGDVWEENIARYHIAASHYRLGDLSATAAEANHIYQSGLEIGDIQASGIAFDLLVRATGHVSAEALQTELQRERYDVQGTAQVKLAEGVRLFMLDRAEEAVDFLESAVQEVERTDVKNSWTFPLRTWLASALRRQAEKTPTSTPERRTLLIRARKVVKKAVKIARKFQTDLPHALREAGLISALQGSDRRARKYLDESLDVAQRQGAKFEHAQTLLARGRVGMTFDWPGAAEQVAAAQQKLIELDADFALSHHGGPNHAETL